MTDRPARPARLMAPPREAAMLIARAAALGVAPRDHAQPTTMTLRDYFDLQRRTTAAATDESLALSMRPLAPGTSDFVAETLVGANKLEDAMRRVARTYNHIHGGFYNRVEVRRDRLLYVIDDHDFPYAKGAAGAETQALLEGILIFLHAMFTLSVGAGAALSPRGVRTRRAALAPAAGLLAFWSAPVKVGADQYALAYDIEAADLPVVFRAGAAPSVLDIYDTLDALIAAREGAAPKRDLLARVEDALASGLEDQGAIAKRLGVSPATLRRRLGETGATFRDLRAAALEKIACAMLDQGRSVAEVAEALGFVDARSFSRAFKQRLGVTPTQYATGGGRVRTAPD